WESPVWRHWMRFFSGHFHFIRHDERGCGMSEWNVGELSLDTWVADLETVIDAAKVDEPATLLGISQGAAICVGYAVRHPERVSRMILYGGYARGKYFRGDPDAAREYRAIIDLIHTGWGRENPAFRQVFTSRFIPRGSEEQVRWFNELCRKTTKPEIAVELMRARAGIDVDALLEQVRVPTLVLHARDDEVTPISEGRRLASQIKGAQFIELDSRNHILLEDEPAWRDFCDAVIEFTGRPAAAFETLSKREHEVLTLLANGLSNAEIATRLGISDKTVRNHLSKLFDKLGVWTRAQAIVFARDHGMGSGL